MKDHHIDFLLLADIERMHFEPHRSAGIEFCPGRDAALRFTLIPSNPEKDPCGNREGLQCKTCATYSVSEEQGLFVDAYISQNVMLRVGKRVRLPFQPRGQTLIGVDGALEKGFRPRRYLCPADIRNLIEKVELELAHHTDRFLKLLRWRQGVDALGEVVKHRTLYWRMGEGNTPLPP